MASVKFEEEVLKAATKKARAIERAPLGKVATFFAGVKGRASVGKAGAATAPLRSLKTAGKIGLVGAALAGGLAWVASAGRSKVTPDSVQNDMLEPEQMGQISPVIDSAEPLLPPLAGQSNETIMGQPPQEGEWVSRMRGGSDEMEKRASVPTPSIAEDMRAEAIRAQKASSDQNLGMGA